MFKKPAALAFTLGLPLRWLGPPRKLSSEIMTLRVNVGNVYTTELIMCRTE